MKSRLEAVEERRWWRRAAQRKTARRRDADCRDEGVPGFGDLRGLRAGYLREFGENYVQEFSGKASELSGLTEARFHLIGHLQSNKAKVAADLFGVIQTVDSAKLAQRLDAVGKPLEVFLEVKLSEEESKFGADPADLGELIVAVKNCPHLKLAGLMTMPPWTDDAEPSRPYFRRLRELGEQHRLSSLSMGMSHDFEVAIEEGATHIRVGTALFGRRKKP